MIERTTKPKPSPLVITPARAGLLQRKCACGGTARPSGDCDACRKKKLQRAANQPSTFNPHPSEAPPIVHEVLRSPGQPLDRETRAFMEPRFGHDFSKVRVHSDAKAAESAQAVNAQAYTAGDNIVFGKGQFSPETSDGNELLAHELTHVLQQSSQTKGFSSLDHLTYEDSAKLENEANHAAAQVNGNSNLLGAQTASVQALQRQSAASGDPKKKQGNKERAYGRYILPQLTITPAGSHSALTMPRAPETNKQLEKASVRDVTFVKVQTVQELNQRIHVLNREAEKELQEKLLRSQGTLTDADPDADAKAQEILKQQFGDGWGTFFWWTRGGGQTGEGSPLWSLLESISGFNRAVPIPRPGGDPVFRDRLPETYRTESTK